MSRTLIIAVLAGIASGMVFITPMFGSILLMQLINFTHLPLFLVGLWLGTAAAGISMAAGSVLVGVALGAVPLMLFAGVFALPAVLASRQALLSRATASGGVDWYPPGRVLSLLVGYGILAFLVIYLSMANSEAGLVEVMETILSQNFAMLAPQLGDDERLAAASQWATMLPAALVATWLTMLAINAAIAQRILVRTGRNRRPSLDLGQIELPLGFAYAIVASGGLWLFADGQAAFIGETLTIIFATAYLFVGLAVVHHVTRSWPGRKVSLTFFYLVFLFVLGLPGLALVAGLGLADQLIGVRRRFADVTTDKENE